ncbi:MAG: DUF2510 domain-containing protein [Acidimicrobiales bacterium]
MEAFLVVVIVIVAVTSIWVVVDAARIGVRRGGMGGGLLDMGIAGWFVACELVWIVAFPLYLASRRRYLGRDKATDESTPAVRAGSPPPAWYPDPTSPDKQRWWDGSAWSQHTLDVR